MGKILSLGLDPGELPAPEVASAMLGRTMTPGVSSGEAPNNDGTADARTLGVGDGPDTGFGSESWFLNWSEQTDEVVVSVGRGNNSSHSLSCSSSAWIFSKGFVSGARGRPSIGSYMHCGSLG